MPSYQLSYRAIEELMAERGTSLDHSTVKILFAVARRSLQKRTDEQYGTDPCLEAIL